MQWRLIDSLPMKWRVRLDKHFIIAAGAAQTIDLSQYYSGTLTVEVLKSASVSVLYTHTHKDSVDLTVYFRVHEYGNAQMMCTSKEGADFVLKVVLELMGKSAFGSFKAIISTGQHCNQSVITEQIHEGVDTESVVSVRATADKKSTHSFEGLIRLEPSSLNARAQQEHKVLLLDPTAHVTSIPSLQVLHDQVVCGHASALCPIDQDDITALQLKGIEESYARLLIIQGFLSQ